MVISRSHHHVHTNPTTSGVTSLTRWGISLATTIIGLIGPAIASAQPVTVTRWAASPLADPDSDWDHQDTPAGNPGCDDPCTTCNTDTIPTYAMNPSGQGDGWLIADINGFDLPACRRITRVLVDVLCRFDDNTTNTMRVRVTAGGTELLETTARFESGLNCRYRLGGNGDITGAIVSQPGRLNSLRVHVRRENTNVLFRVKAFRVTIEHEPVAGPTVTQNPTGSTVCVGGSAQLSAAGSAPNPISYRWRRAGVPISDGPTGSGASFSGTGSQNLTISNFQGADAAGPYDCVLSSSCGTVDTADAAFTAASAPVFTSHPTSQTLCIGHNTSLSIGANGTQPIELRWRHNGVNLSDGPTGRGSSLSGTSTSTLHISNFQAGDAGAYDCVARNLCNTYDSQDAALTAATPPIIITQPIARNVCHGDPVALTTAANSASALTYQWRRAGLSLQDGASGWGSTYTGARTATLAISNFQPQDGGPYDCIITNPCGSVVTQVVALTPLYQISFQPQPASQIVCVGDVATLTFGVGGAGPFTYQWRRDTSPLQDGATGWGSVYSGTNSPTLVITNFQAIDGATYDCVVTGSCAPNTTSGAVLTPASRPQIVTQPQREVVCPGATAEFTCSATGFAPLTYQWNRGTAALQNGPTGTGSTIQGAQTPTLRILNAGPADETALTDLYSCTVTNRCDFEHTTPAPLRVCRGDFDCDGAVNSSDFFNFLGAFFVGDPSADCNRDRHIDSQDLFCFLTDFFTPC